MRIDLVLLTDHEFKAQRREIQMNNPIICIRQGGISLYFPWKYYPSKRRFKWIFLNFFSPIQFFFNFRFVYFKGNFSSSKEMAFITHYGSEYQSSVI